MGPAALGGLVGRPRPRGGRRHRGDLHFQPVTQFGGQVGQTGRRRDPQFLQPFQQRVERGRVHRLDIAHLAPERQLHATGRQERKELRQLVPSVKRERRGDDPEPVVRPRGGRVVGELDQIDRLRAQELPLAAHDQRRFVPSGRQVGKVERQALSHRAHVLRASQIQSAGPLKHDFAQRVADDKLGGQIVSEGIIHADLQPQ